MKCAIRAVCQLSQSKQEKTGDYVVNQLYIKKILNKHYDPKQKLETEEEETTTWDKQGRQVLIVWRNLQLCE